MAKTRDFPTELRHFVKVLNSFRGYHYDYEVFADFIDYTVGCFLFHGDKSLAERLKEKYKEDYPRFKDMLAALVQTMAEQVNDGGWYDALGTLYEAIASNSKHSSLGQFFTPPTVCDFMAQIQAPLPEVGEKPTGLTVNDPASGSGRLLLAFNNVAPGNYLVGQDLDHICTKMTAINMALHGCQGQAVNGNSLNPEDFRFGYEVNPKIYVMGGIPHLFPISAGESYSHIMWKKHLAARMETVELQPQQLKKVSGMQLSLFE